LCYNLFVPPQPTIPNNAEIDKALKEFEAQSQAGKIQKAPEILQPSSVPQEKVDGIQFEVPSYGTVKYDKETETPKMVKLVMKLSGGAIKEQKQAEWVLLAFVVVVIGFSVFLLLSGGRPAPQKPSQELLDRMNQIEAGTSH
jgi:hypothetical protein